MNKKFIILFVCILLTGIITVYLFFFHYKKENITETIGNYLTDRYDGISYNNFTVSIDKQKLYYTGKLRANPTWVNNNSNIEAGKKYFEETGYNTKLLTSSINKLSRRKYSARVSVLYINGYSEDDSIFDYSFVFTIKKRGIKDYVFDNVELASNLITYINGRELHIHDGEVALIDGEDFSSCEDHSHDEINP